MKPPRKSRKGVSRKAKLVGADQVAKYYAAWRVAEALLTAARGEAAPLVTYEAPERFSPWDDVVEEYDDGRCHLYQVKSGRSIPAAEIKELLAALQNFPNAKATLAVTDSPRVSGAPALQELDSALRALRSGAATSGEDDAAGAFLVDACGEEGEARRIANRMSIEFLGNRDVLIDRAVRALNNTYAEDAASDVLGEILAALDQALGHPISVKALVSGKLSRFAARTVAGRAQGERAIRERYLSGVQSAVRARRVLRMLEGANALLDDVWVSPRLAQTGADPINLPDLVTRLRDGEEHNLVGPAGTGKTELLARLASDLASRAERDADEALPIVFNLRDLNASIDGSSIIRAAEQFCSGVGDSLGRLLDRPGARWLLLVDGVDEVKLGAEIVAALRRRFPGSTSIATLRPSVLRGMAPANVLWLEQWREADAVNFLRQLATAYPDSAERLLRLTVGVPGLLQAPLTATLAALVTIQGGVAPANRTQLFRQATETLVQTWADARGVKNPWQSIASVMRAIAMEFVRSERTAISVDELEERLRRFAPDNALLIKQYAEHDFGILIRTGESYEFLVRGMAEYLAGEELAESDDELLNACGTPWAQDVARHALGLRSARNVVSYNRDLRRLVEQDSSSSAGLRGLLVAILTAADMASYPLDIAAQVAEACFSALRDEASPWRADRVAEAVVELAKSDSPVWRVLRERLRTTLRDERRPITHFVAQPPDSRSTSEMLLHCDPEVRSEGVRRLDISDSNNIDVLFTMLHDVPPFPRWGVTPAMEAGLALRRAPRDLLVEFFPILQALSRTPSQLLSAAAAVALHPNEQDRDVLVQAYRRGADGQYLPRMVLDELAKDADGLVALERLWPEWRGYTAHMTLPDDRRAWPSQLELLAPPSDLTRARLVRVLGSEQIVPGDLTLDVLRGPGREHYLEAICDRAISHPEVISQVLTKVTTPFPFFDHRSSRLLANAATRHDSVRQHLFDLWQRFSAHPETRSQFPGRALEYLVINGDLEAAKIYATWLPYAPYLSGVVDEPAPDPDVFKHPVTRAAAQEQLASIVSLATTGFEEGGERRFVAALSAARAFQKLTSVWRGDTVVTPTLISWLDATDSQKSFAALTAFDGPWLEPQQQAKAIDAIRRLINSQEETDRQFRLPQMVPYIDRLGLTQSFLLELRSLTTAFAPVAIAAACVLRSTLPPNEMAEISTSISQGSLQAIAFEALDRNAFEELVRAAPGAWSNAAFHAATQTMPPELDVAIPILEALPLAERRALAQRLADHIGENWQLPWLTSWRANVTYRPSDLVVQLLFDAGVS